jgi:hypothetical protein
VTTSAPRLPPELLQAVIRLDDGSAPIAEVCRRVGAEAERLGLTRPSYERIRLLVHESRLARRPHGPSTARVLVDVALRARPPEALIDHVSGVGLGPHDERAGLNK